MDQKEFFYRFSKAMYHIDAIYDNLAKKTKVSINMLWILYALDDGKAHSQKDICYDWSLPKSTVNTLVLNLKKNEYITLVQIKGTKRDLAIELTEKEKNMLKI